jgi:hypothetical protein
MQCRGWRWLLPPIAASGLMFLGLPVLAASAPEARRPLEISCLGNAGWQITDDKVVILIHVD